MKKIYAVLFDCVPVSRTINGDSNEFYPVTMDEHGHHINGRPKEYIRISDGNGSVFAEALTYARHCFTYNQAMEIAEEYSAKVVPVYEDASEFILRASISKLGAKGGSAKTKAKAAASRENGKLGGRPKKEKQNETR